MTLQPRKYPLKAGLNTVELEGGYNGAHVAFQGDQLNLWVTAKVGQTVFVEELYVAVTGETLPDHPGGGTWGYIGTAVTTDGKFVQHVYYR